MRFLTKPDGEWAAARRTWCDLAGIEAKYLARRVAKITTAASP